MFRLLSILVVALVFTGVAVAVVDEVHEGKVLMAVDGKITIQDKDGNSQVFAVAPEAKITLDGKPVKLQEITNGNMATVTVKTAGDKKSATIVEVKSRK